MKKIVFVIIALIAINIQAQKDGSRNRGNMTSEEMATKRTEQMTSDLDLTEAQEKDVMALNLRNAEEFGKLRGKNRSEMSESERTEFRTKMREFQTANKKEMKEILNDEQYVKWDEMQKERMNKAREQRGGSKKNKKQ